MIPKFPNERTYIVGSISLSPDIPTEAAYEIASKKLKKAGLVAGNARYAVYKRSVDARKKDNVLFVYSIAATGDFPSLSDEKLKTYGITEQKLGEPIPPSGKKKLSARPLIIGSGPAGLFAAWLLAVNGYRPIIIERGGTVSERAAATKLFHEKRVLSTENNIQFGAGGAGTFSDGKLVTRVSDPLCGYVLNAFCAFGAPEEIRMLAKPHIGTDYLQKVVDNMIDGIRKAGGEVYFHCRADGFKKMNGEIVAVETTDGEIPCGAVILAVGNSARDTYIKLIGDGYDIESKPFSVGVRIEHLQTEIDFAMYGKFAEGHGLPHAEYNLSHNTDKRGVYTFCMCPGGEVVAAASEEFGVVVNGMSRHARNGLNANSAVAVSVFREDFGSDPLKAIALQRQIEHAAFLAGGGDYSVPIITVGDFLNGGFGTQPTRVKPTYMEGNAFRLSSPENYLPEFAVSTLKDGLRAFDRKIKGFAAPYALLSGAETRTSAPLRILRQENRTAYKTCNLYPCGEGAGYAGGITSAALDGIHTAEALMAVYAPLGG